MSVTDANPPHPTFVDDYVLHEVDKEWLEAAIKPKQFIHIDQSECIMCEGCVDICPWKCIHMVSTDAVADSVGTEIPGRDPSDKVIFTIDDDVCTRCALCVDRCPTGSISCLERSIQRSSNAMEKLLPLFGFSLKRSIRDFLEILFRCSSRLDTV